MAKKSTGLLADIASMEPAKQTPRTWSARLAEERPEDYAELVAIVREWHAGGHVRDVFPSLTRLYHFLVGEDPRASRKVITICETSFMKFAQQVRNGTESDG